MTDTEIRQRLDQIAIEMSKPHADIERLSKEIDRLLGTTLKSENKALAGVWERSRRR